MDSTIAAYSPDRHTRTGTLLGVVCAALGGGLATLLAWFLLKSTNLPAFGPSMVSRAIATFAALCIILILAILSYQWTRDEHHRTAHPIWRTWLTYGAFYLGPAGLIVATLGIPLSATRLYLDGIQVDQGFRTQFLTRAADQVGLGTFDMNYADLPSFYPGMWFWFGGRLADLLGIPGWEVYQPWALISMSMMACALVPIWQRLTGSLVCATGIAIVTTAIVLVMAPDEPYAAIIAMGCPAALVLARRAMSGHRMAMAGLILYLGLSASTYTLYTGVLALSAIVVAVFLAVTTIKEVLWPLLRLVVVGLSSMAIAALWWGPYFLAILRGAPFSGGTANHYLPYQGTQLPLPMLAPSVIGALCMVGLIYLVVRSGNSDVRMLGLGTAVFYAWVAFSMASSLAGTSLLGFRLDTIITVTLATAGILAIADMRLAGLARLYPRRLTPAIKDAVNSAMAVVIAVGIIAYVQNIPNKNADGIELAYTSTDGYGERADRYPADAIQFYDEIHQTIDEATDTPTGDTVILTDQHNFLSYYPYRGFQAFTSHYANPLGQFDLRNEALDSLAADSWKLTPDEFDRRVTEWQWRGPDAFIFRAVATNDSWNLDLAEDIFPNNPNVRFRGVKFNPAVFAHWTVTQVGPFTVVTR